MDQIRWERMKRAFSVVIARGPSRVSEALNRECGGDEEMARELRPLVEEHFRLAHAGQTLGTDDASTTGVPELIADRFRVLARLGSGGFGDVYRVTDEFAGDESLALKVLRTSDPLALHYFKREFRSLADIHHRNIITLRELIAYRERWMFTMELVDGVDFLKFLEMQPSLQDRYAALRSCLVQLAEGLAALHQRGLLHRDVKPSNVLVTPAGRLVLLDFGLVRAYGEDVDSTFTFAGTPDYMSPEQAAGEAVGEPSDWYAVGVMLYRALTGRKPFHGNSFEVLRRKQNERPVPPADTTSGLPVELNDLCVKLLELDPLKRASYADVARLAPLEAGIQVREPQGALFVGRAEPLRNLADAYAAVEDRPVIVHLCGPSGMGKTVLLREFIRHLGTDASALVFAGRCYEGESVPYQALDDLIDHIGQHFRRLPADRVDQLLPRNFAVLVRMFPVLAPFLSGDLRPAVNLDSIQLRTRALAALREMLGRLTERHRIVLAIDDLQWGDADGCAALNDLLSTADCPPILAVLAYRSEDIDASAPLKALRDPARQPSSRKTIFIDLNRLENADAGELARSLMAPSADEATLRRIVEQSGGSPFLIHEIVRWINSRGAIPVLAQPFSFADVIRSRVNNLSPGSRHFLELIAVAGQPTGLSIMQAAGIPNALPARDELSATRLVRSRVVRGREEVEIYHDRIRLTILAGMDAEILLRRHRELARAFEAAGGQDPERIAVHFDQAHDPQSCCRYALLAARRAVEVLAFNKAALFFEMALATQTLDPGESRLVHRECADALANAGCGPESSEHYLAACAGATIDERLEWNLRAAEQLLYSGHVDRGLAIFETVLGQVGIKLPKASSRATLDLLARRLHLKIRGLRWREAAAGNAPRSILLKIDTCASVATGLSLVDVARGASLQTTSLLLALRAGDPSRIARALAMEAAYASTAGVRAKERVKRLLGLARDLSGRSGDRHAMELTSVMTAACAWNAGRWDECYRQAHAAREALDERYEHLMWERDTAAIFEVDGLRWMGRWSVMKAILPELLADARLRGDLYAQAILQMHGGSCAALANDDPARAREGLAILERWSNTGFHVEHLVETHNRAEIALYLGNGMDANSLILQRWPALRQSLLLRVQALHIQMRSLRARAALCAALDERSISQRKDLLRSAQRESHAIRRQNAGWGYALADLIQGGIESASGRREEAIATYRRADTAAVASGMGLHSAVARRSQGSLMGGDAGRQLVAAAESELAAEGIANPARLAAVIAPGV